MNNTSFQRVWKESFLLMIFSIQYCHKLIVCFLFLRRNNESGIKITFYRTASLWSFKLKCHWKTYHLSNRQMSAQYNWTVVFLARNTWKIGLWGHPKRIYLRRDLTTLWQCFFKKCQARQLCFGDKKKLDLLHVLSLKTHTKFELTFSLRGQPGTRLWILATITISCRNHRNKGKIPTTKSIWNRKTRAEISMNMTSHFMLSWK